MVSNQSGAGVKRRISSTSTGRTYPCTEPPMGVRQNPWTPTKRRGPIAAEAASPGPAVVSLPTLIGEQIRVKSFVLHCSSDRQQILSLGYRTRRLNETLGCVTAPEYLWQGNKGSVRALLALPIFNPQFNPQRVAPCGSVLRSTSVRPKWEETLNLRKPYFNIQ